MEGAGGLQTAGAVGSFMALLEDTEPQPVAPPQQQQQQQQQQQRLGSLAQLGPGERRPGEAPPRHWGVLGTAARAPGRREGRARRPVPTPHARRPCVLGRPV